jgi:T5SS/PEP-CTERM-associated repeat protein
MGDGTVHVGRIAGGQGTLTVSGGSKVLAGQIAIGGSSDIIAGGVGTATVSGLNSELRAAGSVAYISVGLSGSGTLVVNDQAQVNATALGVGRALGGVGTMTVSNGSILLSGQETAAPFAGANLSIGVDGGSGSVSVANGSTIAITNSGSAGASLNVGGSPIRPLGTGTLNVTNSQIDITTAPGLATARIGHDGTGTATLTASSLNLSNGTTRDGSIIVAGLPGSVGTLVLNAGSVINAAYVGVGSTRNPAFDPVTNPTQNPGGIGRLVVNDSEVNTDVFELGAFGVLSGNNGVINVAGDVIIGGTIDPGNSAGRIRINSNLISLPGSRLILEIQSDGSGGFLTDTLVIDSASPFDLRNFDIVFSFLGDTNVQEFAASGGFDFDTFLRSGVGADESQGLSNRFAAGETWADMFDATEITVVSSVFDVSNLSIGSDGGVTVTASRIPEPETWLMMLIGLFAMRLVAPRRRRTFAVAH